MQQPSPSSYAVDAQRLRGESSLSAVARALGALTLVLILTLILTLTLTLTLSLTPTPTLTLTLSLTLSLTRFASRCASGPTAA